MNEQEILSSNRLIAEFMGFNTTDYFRGVFCDNKLNQCDKEYISFDLFTGCKYHNDWNWLMPVVEKIELCYIENDPTLTLTFEIQNRASRIFCNDWGLIKELIAISSKSKIEAVWLAVVEFIKWYNLNK